MAPKKTESKPETTPAAADPATAPAADPAATAETIEGLRAQLDEAVTLGAAASKAHEAAEARVAELETQVKDLKAAREALERRGVALEQEARELRAKAPRGLGGDPDRRVVLTLARDQTVGVKHCDAGTLVGHAELYRGCTLDFIADALPSGLARAVDAEDGRTSVRLARETRVGDHLVPGGAELARLELANGATPGFIASGVRNAIVRVTDAG